MKQKKIKLSIQKLFIYQAQKGNSKIAMDTTPTTSTATGTGIWMF